MIDADLVEVDCYIFSILAIVYDMNINNHRYKIYFHIRQLQKNNFRFSFLDRLYHLIYHLL